MVKFDMAKESDLRILHYSEQRKYHKWLLEKGLAEGSQIEFDTFSGTVWFEEEVRDVVLGNYDGFRQELNMN